MFFQLEYLVGHMFKNRYYPTKISTPDRIRGDSENQPLTVRLSWTPNSLIASYNKTFILKFSII